MQRYNSFSIQKHPLRSPLPRDNSLNSRLSFPSNKDSNIFLGVGRKQFAGQEEQIAFVMPQPNPESQYLRRSNSTRNILSVADIEGASPSVAPQAIRNVMKGKEYMQLDSLEKAQQAYNLKLLSPAPEKPKQGVSSPAVRLNPTYMTSFVLHH